MSNIDVKYLKKIGTYIKQHGMLRNLSVVQYTKTGFHGLFDGASLSDVCLFIRVWRTTVWIVTGSKPTQLQVENKMVTI